MKNNYFSKGILFLLAIPFFFSCRSTNYLTLRVEEPAPVYVPISFKRVGLLDQSLPSDATKKIDDLDKILSIEEKNLDKDGAEASLKSLSDELSANGRFTDVRILNDASVKSPGMGIFPAPLSWDKVQQICYDNQVDILFVLSFYDTDTRVEYAAIPVELTGPLGVKIPALEHQATVYTLIKTGWRIYDPINKIIRDEYLANEQVVLSGRGINPVKAMETIIGRKQAVLQQSMRIGQNYASRILPYYIRVSRTYYVRGTNNFVIGKRRAQTGNWDGAAELWQKDIDHPKTKVAGRATYNMAIINEINGDLNKAIEWASKSYTDYNNKLALSYLKVLKQRQYTNEQLRQQNQ